MLFCIYGDSGEQALEILLGLILVWCAGLCNFVVRVAFCVTLLLVPCVQLSQSAGTCSELLKAGSTSGSVF